MASLREAFTNPEVQSDFYSQQQIRYREVEPNRFLPDQMKGNLSLGITNDTLSQFDRYDPYTESVSNKFSALGLSQLLRGQGDTTSEETACRGYTGAASLPGLIASQQTQGTLPVRCGWRYKKSPEGGAPLVSQGALGTINGPLNPQADPLGNGVEWIWDLKKALDRHTRDFVATLPVSASGLTAAQSQFANTAYCAQTNSYIQVDSAGNPLQGYTCAANSIITNPANIPQTSQTSAASMANTNTTFLTDCMRPGNNPSLSRDCLLQAIKTNGCATDGTLYQAIESANPTGTTFSQYLQTQPSFLTYQSRQGDNKITENLFNKELGSWDMATREIQKLQTYTQTAQDPLVKVAAEDLCIKSGTFDDYDFCSDLTDSTSIGGVELKCMQAYWQEKNGKPAGLLYPTNKTLKPELGTISTWGQFRNAVDQMRTKINSTDPIEQRKAINNFLGVSVNSVTFSPLNLDAVDQQFALGGQPLQLWIDAKDGGSLTIDQNNRVRNWNDKSGKNNNSIQTSIVNRPLYKQEAYPGIEFDGFSSYLNLGSLYSAVAGNFTVFIVEKRKTSNLNNYFIGGSSTNQNTNLVLGYRYNTVATMAFWANDFDVTIPSYQTSLEPARIWMFEKNTTGRKMYINGSLVGGDNKTSNLSSWNNPVLGGLPALSVYYKGIVYEVLIYNQSLATDRRQKLEGYLAHKWGLSGNLPGNHPYKTNAP